MHLRQIATAAIAGLLVLTGTAAAAPPELTSRTVFNNPRGDGEDRIVKHLVEMIHGAKKGSSIVAAAMVFEDRRIIDALLNASRSGIRVTVIYDAANDDADRLLEKLKEAGNGSRAVVCTGDSSNACIGSGRMHSKFFLFSETLGAKNVVSVGTANLNDESAKNSFNSWYTETNNEGLYKYYGGYVEDLLAENRDNNYYDHRKPREFEGIKAYFYPRDDGGDTFVNTFRAVKCDGGTKIRIANYSFSRKAVAEELLRLAEAGCEIEIIVAKFHETACKMLVGHKNVRAWGFGFLQPYVHGKNLMIQGHYSGAANQRVVWTGSHNLNTNSLRLNDETVLRIMNRPSAYASFVSNFETIKKRAVERDRGNCPWGMEL
jgi:phosphatidylserine/phosphatidylglycerophosphate/cardiolipin synthase-like enzyme